MPIFVSLIRKKATPNSDQSNKDGNRFNKYYFYNSIESNIFIYTLAIICSDFAYGCTSFPTFGIPDKNIPAKIKELLDKHVPF